MQTGWLMQTTFSDLDAMKCRIKNKTRKIKTPNTWKLKKKGKQKQKQNKNLS